MLNTVKEFENRDLSEVSEYDPPVVLLVVLILIDFISIMILENQIVVPAYSNWLFYTALVTGSIATLIILTLCVLGKKVQPLKLSLYKATVI